MQLLKIALYHIDGRVREVDFRPGELNIVTGKSRTGKSAILTIVDYCLGRDKVEMPPGVIRKYVAWFGTLWQLDTGSRVFLGRPALEQGRTETSRMMVSFGGPEMGVPDFVDLIVNSDSNSARSVLGQQLGLVDAKLATAESSLKSDTTVTLGSAAFYCFQEQQEVANKSLLFHRQNDEGVAITIRDTLPFFLGALPGDNAAKHARLRATRRELRAANQELRQLVEDGDQISGRLAVLLAEAHEAGMISVTEAPSSLVAVQILNGIRYAEPAAPTNSDDVEAQNRRRTLESERVALRLELGEILDSRALLLDVVQGEGGFGQAVGIHQQRLSSLDLLEIPADSNDEVEHSCPVCLQPLRVEDPLPHVLHARLESLRAELESMTKAEPARRAALDALDLRAREGRERLITLEAALRLIDEFDSRDSARASFERREFIRGRIDATLAQFEVADDDSLVVLRQRVQVLEQRVSALEDELDDDLAAQRLRSVVTKLSARISELAVELEVENAENGVWLDVDRLTVIVDTDTGPATLSSIGSGANWMGIHLAVHLALHELFVRENRPVPHLLMLDQPTQVFYESQYVGDDELTADEDHDAVARMFQLMFDVIKRNAPDLQLIVSDHANLPEPWFADSVRHNWRNGEGLIPSAWIE
jgi:hypothetical protein